jgi:hypothetical protein
MLDNEAPRHLLASFYPNGLPDSYVVIDVTSTGLQPGVDLVLSLSSMIVVNGAIHDCEHQYLRWSRILQPETLAWYAKRLERSEQGTASDLDRGEDAAAVLTSYVDLFRQVPRDVPIVGHTIVDFKWPLIHANLARYGGLDAVLEPLLHDVGLWQKAVGAGIYPQSGESLLDFQKAIRSAHAVGAFWSLPFCVARHGINPPVPPSDPFYRVQVLRQIYQVHHDMLASMNIVNCEN